jgi:hypothetical protein
MMRNVGKWISSHRIDWVIKQINKTIDWLLHGLENNENLTKKMNKL